MKKYGLSAIVVFLLSVSFQQAQANIYLPAIIGNHMVLQQNSECKLWGWSNANEDIAVSVSWDTAVAKTIASNGGKWMVTVKTPKAGGPFSIVFKGQNIITVDDVVTGEVWDCSGQSNMEMSDSWGNQLYSSEIAQANNKNIRLFYIPKSTSPYPQEDVRAHWVVCNPDDARLFSMAGYFFGKQLNETLQAPVGLINANWGGTPAETWTPKELVENDAVLKEAAAKVDERPWWPHQPGYAYNAMIYPITNYNIAGVIWYQGEANVGIAFSYSKLMTTMINGWRAAFKKDFPFYYVQIAPFEGYGKTIMSSVLREQQTKTLSVPNTGMIVVHDLVENVKDIHPRDKKNVGLRLANLALTKTYGVQNLPYAYPMYKSMSVEKGKLRISFSNADKGLMAKGDTISGFYIAGADKAFVPAQAKIDGNTVIVSSKGVKEPVAVRFGFTSADMPNLFSREGLPMNLFRTDDWDDVATTK